MLWLYSKTVPQNDLPPPVDEISACPCIEEEMKLHQLHMYLLCLQEKWAICHHLEPLWNFAKQAVSRHHTIFEISNQDFNGRKLEAEEVVQNQSDLKM